MRAKKSKKPSAAPAEMLAFPFPTALGPMAIVWAGEKIVATQLPEKNKTALLETLRLRLRAPTLRWQSSAPSFVRKLADQITRHLSGEAQKFSLDHVALENIPPFFRKVYEVANRIPSGKVLTYGEVALAAGSPKASRAVGQAMAKNPFLLLVPCHRVVGGSRKLVGFSAHGGVKTKASLLELESLANVGTSHHQS